MVEKYIRIGSAVDVVGYDNADWPAAIETDEPMKAGPPIADNDVLRLGDMLSIILSTSTTSGYSISLLSEITRRLNRVDANEILKNQVFGRRS